jgi:hypothetical protein
MYRKFPGYNSACDLWPKEWSEAMIENEILDILVEKEFPMRTEEIEGKLSIIGEVVASNPIEEEFLQYKLKIFAEFENEEFSNLSNMVFPDYAQATKMLGWNIWFTHAGDDYNPDEVAIEDGRLKVIFSNPIFNLLGNSLNEHSVQDLFDYILGSACIYIDGEDGKYDEPTEEPTVGLFP